MHELGPQCLGGTAASWGWPWRPRPGAYSSQALGGGGKAPCITTLISWEIGSDALPAIDVPTKQVETWTKVWGLLKDEEEKEQLNSLDERAIQ